MRDEMQALDQLYTWKEPIREPLGEVRREPKERG